MRAAIRNRQSKPLRSREGIMHRAVQLRRRYYVVPDEVHDGKWVVKKLGANSGVQAFASKDAAVVYASKKAKATGFKVKVFDKVVKLVPSSMSGHLFSIKEK